MKQVEVTILGQSYLLGFEERGLADVDREMSAIRDGGKVKARERIAVLAALNLAFALAERPAPTPAARTHEGMNRAGPVDIDDLVRRIDMTLNVDGQLL